MSMAPDEQARKHIAETSGVTDAHLAHFGECHDIGFSDDDG
ncbi:hypothetical protein [Streptomyces sp. NPDC001744]